MFVCLLNVNTCKSFSQLQKQVFWVHCNRYLCSKKLVWNKMNKQIYWIVALKSHLQLKFWRLYSMFKWSVHAISLSSYLMLKWSFSRCACIALLYIFIRKNRIKESLSPDQEHYKTTEGARTSWKRFGTMYTVTF